MTKKDLGKTLNELYQEYNKTLDEASQEYVEKIEKGYNIDEADKEYAEKLRICDEIYEKCNEIIKENFKVKGSVKE